MTDRIPLDAMTSDALDQLYDERDQLRRERDGISRMYLTAMADLGIAINRLDHVRSAVHIADDEDVTDWQRGYRACAERALTALDARPADDTAATQATDCPGHEDCTRCDVTDPCPCCGITYRNGQWATATGEPYTRGSAAAQATEPTGWLHAGTRDLSIPDDSPVTDIDPAWTPPPPGDRREHTYLSTGCFHGDHAYCQSMTGLNGAKRPAVCKFCQASCRCECHTTTKEN